MPDADVQGWEHYMVGLVPPDPDDRYGLAAALAAGAGTIRTMNLWDFSASALAALGLQAFQPNGFLCELLDADPEVGRAATEAAHANLSRGMPSFKGLPDTLERQGLPALTQRLRA